MTETGLILLIHQFIFQGMFMAKNILLKRKTGKQIRGKNKEATLSILFFTLFIVVALLLSFFRISFGEFLLISHPAALAGGVALLLLNILISAASLTGLKDSWRVGVLKNQKTELITGGIYRYTRNPYFVAYLLMFAAYTLLLQNLILLILSLAGFWFIHKMILKEEEYLVSVHGESYSQYKKRVPRYIFI